MSQKPIGEPTMRQAGEAGQLDQQPDAYRWPGDPLAWFSGALVLIWAGIVLLFRNAGEVAGFEIEHASAWILTGAGLLMWLEAILRLAIPAYSEGVGTRIILGVIFVIVGLGEVVQVSLWPLLLMAIGLAMIVGYFVYPRRT